MTTNVLNPVVDDAVRELRGAIRVVLASVGADPRQPQEVHRRFSLTSTLCWKISRLERATTSDEALGYLPGSEAFQTYLNALEIGGANAKAVQSARRAMDDLSDTVKRFIGDKNTLELILDAAGSNREQLAMSRKLAFRGNSGIWGVQAKGRYQLIVRAPNTEDPNVVDTANVAGWIDFRRIRLDASGRVFRRRVASAEGGTVDPIPIDADEEPGGVMLIREFCEDLPEISTTVEGDWHHYNAGPSLPGTTGKFTIFSGLIQRKHSLHWEQETKGRPRFFASVMAPVEELVFDFVVHKDLHFARHATAEIHSGAFDDHQHHTSATMLPIDCPREELGAPPLVEMAVFSRASSLLDVVLARGGWDRDDFYGVRYRVEYPPFPSVVVVRGPREIRAD